MGEKKSLERGRKLTIKKKMNEREERRKLSLFIKLYFNIFQI